MGLGKTVQAIAVLLDPPRAAPGGHVAAEFDEFHAAMAQGFETIGIGRIEEGHQPRQAVKHPHEQQGKDKANRADALWKHQAASLREEPLFQ